MYKNELKSLKKFIRPSPAIFLMGAVFSIFSILLLIGAISGRERDNSEMTITGIVGLILGVVISIAGIYTMKKGDKKLAEIDANGGTQILLNDFRSGGRAFKDSLILGQTFLIGKHTGTIITYNDIVQIYQYVHKTNYVEDSRTLKVVLAKNRKAIDLCNIPLRGKGDDEVVQVINFILSNNPNIKVGYK